MSLWAEILLNVSAKVILQICGKLVRQDFETNDFIIKKGDIEEYFYIIYSGSVDFYSETNDFLCSLGPFSVI